MHLQVPTFTSLFVYLGIYARFLFGRVRDYGDAPSDQLVHDRHPSELLWGAYTIDTSSYILQPERRCSVPYYHFVCVRERGRSIIVYDYKAVDVTSTVVALCSNYPLRVNTPYYSAFHSFNERLAILQSHSYNSILFQFQSLRRTVPPPTVVHRWH